jgi:Ribbon-helix-helix protein, copG family
MDGQILPSADSLLGQGEATSRAVKMPRRRGAKQSDARGQHGASQVSLTLPRELLAAYDQTAKETGINRAHLMREALSMYSLLLAGGGRFYEPPMMRRAG